MTDQLLLYLKQTLTPINEIRLQAEENLNLLKQQNVRELISILIQIIKSDYYNVDMTAYLATLIYTWRLFPSNIQEIPEGQPHPFEVFSEELVHQLLDCSFCLMTNKASNQQEVPPKVRNLASNLFSRIASLQVHYDVHSKIIQKLSESLAQAQSFNDVYPISQALQTICEGCEPDEEELSCLLTTLFNLFASPVSPQIISELLNILAKIVTAISSILVNEEILANIIATLLTLSTVDGVQAAAFNVWSCIYKTSEDIITAVADQLVPISLSILADENKSEDDIKSACKLIKQISKLELKYDDDQFIPIRRNAQPLIIALTRVCCTSDNEDCDQSLWLPYLAASQALKNVFILLPDDILESIFPIMRNLASSEAFNERLGALIILSRIIKFADNEYIGFQFIPSLFNLLATDKVPCVICQVIKCLKYIIMRIAESAFMPNSQSLPNQEVLGQLPQICENCYTMMIQILAINEAQTQQQAPQQAEFEEIVEKSTINLSSFQRNADNADDDLFSPIALQAAGLIAEISRTPGFLHTFDALNILLQNGMKYKVSKFFDNVSKIVDHGSDVESVLRFFQVILDALNTSIQLPTTIWALHELGENVQAYFARFDVQLAPHAQILLHILIQGIQAPSIYASDALIPIGMLAKIFPTVFAGTLINQRENQQPISAAQLILNLISHGLNEIESSDMIYNSSLALSYIVWSTNAPSEDDGQSSEFIGSLLSQATPVFLTQLTRAISCFDLSIAARRSCVDCIADLANYQPQMILPMVDQLIIFLRTFVIFPTLNLSLQTDPEETQLMLKALAKCILNIMRAVGPENAINYKDIAENIISFVASMNESDGVIERSISSAIELLLYISNLDKNFVLEMISEDESVGTLILTARANSIEHSQEILDILGYTEQAAE